MQDKAILLDKAADIAIIFKIRRVSLEHLFFFSVLFTTAARIVRLSHRISQFEAPKLP